MEAAQRFSPTWLMVAALLALLAAVAVSDTAPPVLSGAAAAAAEPVSMGAGCTCAVAVTALEEMAAFGSSCALEAVSAEVGAAAPASPTIKL